MAPSFPSAPASTDLQSIRKEGLTIAVVVPTLNERENIGPLIDAVFAAFANSAHRLRMLVVDDASPDGTSTVVRERMRSRQDLALLDGPRCGLGAAYVHGLRHALAEYAPDAVIQMDADFSHIPGDLPRLIAALDAGADLAIGSRYVDGNRTPRDWGWRRRALSWGGNLVARHWLRLAPIRDCTAGFRAWRASALRKARFMEVDAQGYVFLVALLKNAVESGANVREVPVEFPDRIHGNSKLGSREIVEFARWALRNRLAARSRPKCATEAP